MDPDKDMWGDDEEESPSNSYTPSVSATITSPGKARVNEVFGMLYSTLNGVQRLMHMAVDASDGLVSEKEARSQLSQLEHWVEQATETMQLQASAIDNLKKMLDIYEKSVWVKTKELSEAHTQSGNANDDGSREAIINSLQEQLAEMEQRYDKIEVKQAEQCFSRLLTENHTQTDSLPSFCEDFDTEDVRRRAKVNPRHPMFLKLKCMDCKMPMTKKRWEKLPRSTQRQLAFLQIEVDRFIKGKQKEVTQLLPTNCLGCVDLRRVEQTTKRFSPDTEMFNPPKKVESQPMQSNNVFRINMDQISSHIEDDALLSGRTSQRSSIILAPSQSKNILKRGMQILRKKENAVSGDTTFMVRLAVLNKLRERGTALDILVSKETVKQKLGLRVKKNLCIEGYDPNSLAESMSSDFPIGHFIVAIDSTPVEKVDSTFSKLMGQQQLTITVSEAPFLSNAQLQLNDLLMGDAAFIARSSVSLTEPLPSEITEDEVQTDRCDLQEEQVFADPLSEKQSGSEMKSEQHVVDNQKPTSGSYISDDMETSESESRSASISSKKKEEFISPPPSLNTPQVRETSNPPVISSSQSMNIVNTASVGSSVSSINVTPRLEADRPVNSNTPNKSIKDTASSWFNKLVKKPPNSSPQEASNSYTASTLHSDAFPDS